jgi:hypothetical protein
MRCDKFTGTAGGLMGYLSDLREQLLDIYNMTDSALDKIDNILESEKDRDKLSQWIKSTSVTLASLEKDEVVEVRLKDGTSIQGHSGNLQW